MKSLLIPLLLALLALPLSAQFRWMDAASVSNYSERFVGICTGPSGEIFSVGTTGSAGQPTVQSYGQYGSPGFYRVLTNTPAGTAVDVHYDQTTDRLVVAGTQSGRPFLELLDPVTGATISRTTFVGSGRIKAIDVTPTHIYAIGNYSGSLTFGTQTLSGGSAFVAQFSLSGVPLQSIDINAPLAKGFDVKVDASDNVYFTLSTQGNIVFGAGQPGNYTYTATNNEEFVLVQADATFQAQYSQLLRATDSPLTAASSEVPLELNEAGSLVYVGIPWEPNTAASPGADGGIASFDLTSGTPVNFTPLPDRTVRDLAFSCDELFAVGGAESAFPRTTCGNASHAAWFQRYDAALVPGSLQSSTFCSWGEAIAADDYGHVAVAGGFDEATSLTWGGVTANSTVNGGMTARIDTGSDCCTQSVERCLAFDGNNNGLLFVASPLQASSAFTFELWFSDEGVPSPTGRTLFLNSGGTDLGAEVINGQLNARVGGTWSGPLLPVTPDRWYQLMVSYDGSLVNFYLDGALVHQRITTLNLSPLLTIGAEGFPSPPGVNDWVGKMDNLAAYDAFRGPGAAADKSGCVPSLSDPELLMFLPLDQGNPGQFNGPTVIARDQTAAGIDGTLRNFTLNGQASNWVCSDLILPVCPLDTCGAPLAVNTFSRYRAHYDLGSTPATDTVLDVGLGAFRLPGGDIVHLGAVQGSDNHNPLYVSVTDPMGNPVGNPILHHPLDGSERLDLSKSEPTPIRNATGTITGFLVTGVVAIPGNAQQRVLLQFDPGLTLVNSRFYQPLDPGVEEVFTDVIQDSNGDFIAIGNTGPFPISGGFAMRIAPNLLITDYQRIGESFENIYLDKIEEASFQFGTPGFGSLSAYVLGGHSDCGDAFVLGLGGDLKLAGSSAVYLLGAPGAGTRTPNISGLHLLSDGRLAVISTTTDGRIWLSLFYNFPGTVTTPTGTYVIDVDSGEEEALATALRPGNRLLIGGRAEAANTFNDDSRGLLLEVDLDNLNVNFVRTYGNANYPESLVVDVYADDDGIVLNGYGISARGVSLGGFGSLSHLDSWLAATDTLGRVFDCDCYETSGALIDTTTITLSCLSFSYNFQDVNPGQDDLQQQIDQALYVDDFCDQSVGTPSAPCAGGTESDRDDVADNTQLNVTGGVWTLSNILPDGFELTVDWGDGTVQTITNDSLPLRHVYSMTGNYQVCIDYVVYAADGTVCWQRNDCEGIVSSVRGHTPAVDLMVYPNPTNGKLYLRYDANLGAPALAVFSTGGRRVKAIDRLARPEVSLTDLPAGMYVFVLRFPGGEMARQRVILR